MNNLSFSNSRLRLTFIIWWVIWAALHCYVLTNYLSDAKIIITDSLISNAAVAGICLLISNNMRYYLPRQERYWYVLIISLVLSLVALQSRWLLWLIFRDNEAYLFLISQSLSIRFLVNFLLIGCMSMLSLLWYTLKEQNESEVRKTKAEEMVRDAELFRLRQQLQPHFLFNSLNSISALTVVQPQLARHMINQLSEFLRGTLKKDEHQLSSLQEELQYLNLYLEIEKVRFGHRLQTEIVCNEETNGLQLPALLLQPVVENAIKFGLYDTIEDVTIKITSHKMNNDLVIQVENPFDVETAATMYGTGFGLASIHRRLFLLFARQDLLKTNTTGNIFTTTIIIPQIVSEVK